MTYDVMSLSLNEIIVLLSLLNNTPSSKIKFGDKHFTSPFHLQKRLPLMLTTLSGRTRFFNEPQSANAPFPMLVTPSGITRLAREEQPKNVSSPMLVIPSGRTILFKEEQKENALSPMLVTLLGITRLRKDLQSSNALSQIIFVPSFMA